MTNRNATKFKPWIADPPWQNFSSMFREAVTASEATTGIEWSHHVTASLYFGIAALEAFLNQKRRTHEALKSEQHIHDLLRSSVLKKKLRQWPKEMLGVELNLNPKTMAHILLFNDIRSDLTHPKTQGPDIYLRLQDVEPRLVIATIAEYIVRYHEAEGTRYPYWIFGWNYLNPSPDPCEMWLINDQQFCFSLQNLGFRVAITEGWMNAHFGSFDGYSEIELFLCTVGRCEPKVAIFPFQPKLCRRWWDKAHHLSCGQSASRM